MPQAMEVVTGFVVNPGAVLTPWTLAVGNTLTVRNSDPTKRAWLLQLWADNQQAGTLQVRSPKMHDNVRGIREAIVASEVKPLLTYGFPQKLFSQDLLVAEQSATGSAAGDIQTGSLLIWYEDLPGASARLVNPADVIAKLRNIVTVENTITAGAAGGYSGQEPINAESDLLKANTDYALLGYLVNVETATVRWTGSDFGNLGVGGPGDELGRDVTKNWFAELAMRFGVPLIPVFNSANRAAVLVDVAQDENAAAVTVTSILAELGA